MVLTKIRALVSDLQTRLSLFIGSLIADHLSFIFIDFKATDFRLSFTGELVLENVNISRDVFLFLGDLIPWQFVLLRIRHIRLHLPLFNLLDDGLALEISGVTVALDAYDLNRHRQIERPKDPFAVNLQALPPVIVPAPEAASQAEALDLTSHTSSFIRVLTILASHARASLKDVHVDIIDGITNPQHPNQLAVSFAEVRVASCDQNGAIDSDCLAYRPTLFMALQVAGLRASFGSADDIPPEEDCLIKHNGCVAVVAGLRLGTTADHEDLGLGNQPGPFITLSGSITNELALSVSDKHMAAIWDLLHRLTWWSRCVQVKWLRPVGRVKDGPSRWWKFGYAVLNEELNAKLALLRCTTWSCIIAAAERRRRYIRLYRKHAMNKHLTAEECIELSQLDLGLPVECLRRYRAVADKTIPKTTSLLGKITDTAGSLVQLINDALTKKKDPDEDEPEEILSPRAPNASTLFGSYRISVEISSLTLKLITCSNQLCFLDLALSSANATLSANAAFTKLSLSLAVGALQSSRNARGLSLECSDKPLDTRCELEFTQEITLLGISARLADTTVYVPGQFLTSIMKWLSTSSAPLFYLVPPTLFQQEIAEVMQDHVQRNIAPAFRMDINASIGPLTAVAHTGLEQGPLLHACLGQLVLTCSDALNIDTAKFPEFSRAVNISKGDRNIYEYFSVTLDRLAISYDENSRVFDKESQTKRDGLKIVRDEKVEASALLLTTAFPKLPYLLADISLPTIKATVSAGLYRVALYVLSTFAVESPATQDVSEVNAMIAAETAFTSESDSVQTNTLMPYLGSRILLQAPCIELVLLDQFLQETLSVWRLRTSAFRAQAVVKSDGMLRSSIRVQFESWYMNHVVHAWEPLIEPWTVALAHTFDGVASHDISLKGDIRPLNVTFSSALAETLVHVGQTFNLLPAPKQTWQSANIIINDSGASIVVTSTAPVLKAEMAPDEHLVIPSTSSSSRRYVQMPQIQVELADAQGPGPLRVPYSHPCLVENGFIAATVTTTFGYATVRVHSLCVFKNATGHDLDVALQSGHDSNFFQTKILSSNSKIYLPLQIVNNGHIMVKLHGHQVGFSTPIEIHPVNELTSGSFDLVLKSEPVDTAAENNYNPSRTGSTCFAFQKNASRRLLGHQNVLENQLVISVSPMVTIENLLYSACSLRITSTTGDSAVELHEIKCGDRIECFMNESDVLISVSLQGCSFSEPVLISQRNRAGLTAIFKNDSIERGSIGVPSDGQAQSQKIYQNYIAYEMESQPGNCPVVRIFAPFWMVNHTPKNLFFVCGHDKSRDPANRIPTYPTNSRHGVPMLMAGCDDSQHSQCWLQTSTTSYSDPIPLSKLESGVSILLKETDDAEFEMRLKIVRASGRFSRTKVIFIMPQLVIVNCLNRSLYLRQNAHDTVVEIGSNSRLLDYAVPEPNRPRLMRCSLEPTLTSGWSGLFAFNVLGHNSLSVQTRQSNVEIIECIIKQRDNIVYAVFRQGDIRFPPCRIENQTRFSIEISQTGLGSWISIPPFSKVPFCWLEPLSALGLDARFEGSPDTTRTFDMDTETSSESHWKTAKGDVQVTTAQDESPSKILRLEELIAPAENPSGSSDYTTLINKSSIILESCIKFAEKQYKKDFAMVDSMRTRPSKLFITVVEAWDIPAVDKSGLCDPFIEIVAGESKDSTPVQKKQLNAHFHYSTVMQIRDGMSSVLFRVVDQNVVKDEVIGGFEIALSTLADEQVSDAWYKIYKFHDKELTKTRESGQVRVVAQWIRTPEAMKSMLQRDLDKSTNRFRHHLLQLSQQKESITAEYRRERASVITSTREGIQKLLDRRRRSTAIAIPVLPFARLSKQRIITGKFRIGIISARNCLVMDSNGASDPYCKISYGTQAYQTKVIKKNLNPDWDQSFEFEYENHPSTAGYLLRIALFDQDQTSEDDFMGEVVLAINDYIDVPARNVVQEWHQVISMNKYADDLFRSELGESAVNRGDVLIEFEWNEVSVEKYEFNAGFNIAIPAVGLSIVDSGYQRELMYISLIDTVADCIIEKDWKDYSVSVSVGNVQIDNPDVNSGGGETSQMVILGVVRDARDPPQPMIQLVLQSRYLTDLFDFFPYVNLLILGITISLNTKWLSNVLWLVQHLIDLTSAGYSEPLPPPLLLENVPVVGQESGRKVFFGIMVMSPLSIAITLRHGISGSSQRRSDYDWILKLASSVALENCQINLNALGLSNHVSNYDDLINLIMMHYIKNAAAAAFSVLGSSDLLGNPVQLMTGLGSGVKDFFFEPAAGLALGPAAFGRGLLKGSAALLSGTLGGFANSASKVTGNLGNLAAAITMDEEYKAKARQRQLQFNTVDASGLQTMVAGGSAFSRGILSGVTGVVVDPFKGAKQDGVKGFVKGIGKGLVGAVTKPISGTLQLASAAAGGVRNAASTYNRNNHRRQMLIRFPRHFYGMHRRIKLYSATVSKGKFLLDIVHRSKYRGDDFIDILDLPDNKSLILSSKRLLMVSIDAQEAITHALVVSETWMVPIGELKTESLGERYRFVQNGKQWEIDLSQVPPQQVERFFKNLQEMIEFASDGSVEQKYWIVMEKDEPMDVFPLSPLPEPRSVSVPPLNESNAKSAENNEVAALESELTRLKTGLSAAVHTGTTLEVTISAATGLTLKTKMKTYCHVSIKAKPSAAKLLHQNSLTVTSDPNLNSHDSVVESEPLDVEDPFWGLSCRFPMNDPESYQLVIKVYGVRLGKDKLIGQAICSLDELILEKEENRTLPLLKSKRDVEVNRGTVEFSLKLCNPHMLTYQAQMEIVKHRLQRAARKATIAHRFIEDLYPQSEASVIQSEVEQSEMIISDGENSHLAGDDEADDIEDSLRRQYRTLSDRSYLRDASLRDLNAMVQFEVIKARNFKIWSKKKPPGFRAFATIAGAKFFSESEESWEPIWNLRFVIKMPQVSPIVHLKVQRKTFLGAKTIGKINVDFESLVTRASVTDGSWIGLNRDGSTESSDYEVELLVRIQIKSQILEELVEAENAVADELHIR